MTDLEVFLLIIVGSIVATGLLFIGSNWYVEGPPEWYKCFRRCRKDTKDNEKRGEIERLLGVWSVKGKFDVVEDTLVDFEKRLRKLERGKKK